MEEGNVQVPDQDTSQHSPLNNGNQFPPIDQGQYLIVPIMHRPMGLDPGMFLQRTPLWCPWKAKVNNSCSVIAISKELYIHGIKIINKFLGSDPHNREYYIKCGACEFTLASQQFGGSPTEREGYLPYETALIDMNIHVARNHKALEPLKGGRPFSTSPRPKRRYRCRKASTTLRKPYFYRNLPSFICDVCGRSVRNLARHKQIHLNHKREVCQRCGLIFSARLSMIRHMTRHCIYSSLNIPTTNSSSETSPPNIQEDPSPVVVDGGTIAQRDCDRSESPSSSSATAPAPEQNQNQQIDCSEDDLDILCVESSAARLLCNGVDIYLCTSASKKMYVQCGLCSYTVPTRSVVDGMEVYELAEMETHILNSHVQQAATATTSSSSEAIGISSQIGNGSSSQSMHIGEGEVQNENNDTGENSYNVICESLTP
ncbi:unnamed protein product [Orchesella dallaii]|uniref:C2H2-type domain-containing protein n=1 Tax=Orchesella dallaii TaxID=48710 RepID=A0ABP1S8M5_9HEXA